MRNIRWSSPTITRPVHVIDFNTVFISSVCLRYCDFIVCSFEIFIVQYICIYIYVCVCVHVYSLAFEYFADWAYPGEIQCQVWNSSSSQVWKYLVNCFVCLQSHNHSLTLEVLSTGSRGFEVYSTLYFKCCLICECISKDDFMSIVCIIYIRHFALYTRGDMLCSFYCARISVVTVTLSDQSSSLIRYHTDDLMLWNLSIIIAKIYHWIVAIHGRYYTLIIVSFGLNDG